MALFHKIEDFFSDHMDKFLNKKFSHDLQLIDIEKRLNEELILKKTNDAGKFYIPDNYTIILAETDYQKLNELATYQCLYQFIVQMAIKNDFYLKHDPVVLLASNMIKDTGSFSIQSLLSDDTVFADDNDELNHTIVFQKGFVKKTIIDYSKLTFSNLKIIDGTDKRLSLAIGKKRIHIGRRENNEIALHDVSCSRLHAYIDFENYRHVVYDADSLNGTYVNGNLIHQHQLKFGDKITIGDTVIAYDIFSG